MNMARNCIDSLTFNIIQTVFENHKSMMIKKCCFPWPRILDYYKSHSDDLRASIQGVVRMGWVAVQWWGLCERPASHVRVLSESQLCVLLPTSTHPERQQVRAGSSYHPWQRATLSSFTAGWLFSAKGCHLGATQNCQLRKELFIYWLSFQSYLWLPWWSPEQMIFEPYMAC